MFTKGVLVAVLAVTAVAVGAIAARDEHDARTTAVVLGVFTALFALRVAGQVLVALRAPAWLPPMEKWNLVPYRFLLPIQLVFLVVMGAIVVGLSSDRSDRFGRFLIAFSGVYAAAMAVRYVVRMWRRPEERWFGGAIPIVFHVVLAAFLFTWGTYHAAG